MATVTFRLTMIAFQGIGRIPVVFEEDDSPVPFCVTALTAVAIPFLVLVLFLVAGRAIGRGLVFVHMPLMAGLAFRCDMPSS